MRNTLLAVIMLLFLAIGVHNLTLFAFGLETDNILQSSIVFMLSVIGIVVLLMDDKEIND